jgi:hypothetical protein
MFQFSSFPPHCLWIQQWVTEVKLRPGFPIRRPLDIASAHDSPGIFAVYRVLLRLLAPRHSPYALNSFTRDAEKLKFVISFAFYSVFKVSVVLPSD